MTKFKKELRKRGFKLECDYNFLPFDDGAILDSIQVDVENCTISYYYTSVSIHIKINKDFTTNEYIV
jgi:hypothetical protein